VQEAELQQVALPELVPGGKMSKDMKHFLIMCCVAALIKGADVVLTVSLMAGPDNWMEGNPLIQTLYWSMGNTCIWQAVGCMGGLWMLTTGLLHHHCGHPQFGDGVVLMVVRTMVRTMCYLAWGLNSMAPASHLVRLF